MKILDFELFIVVSNVICTNLNDHLYLLSYLSNDFELFIDFIIVKDLVVTLSYSNQHQHAWLDNWNCEFKDHSKCKIQCQKLPKKKKKYLRSISMNGAGFFHNN